MITLRRDPHLAIKRAANAGKGVHLSAEEVSYLMMDDAIAERAYSVECGEAEYSSAVEIRP